MKSFTTLRLAAALAVLATFTALASVPSAHAAASVSTFKGKGQAAWGSSFRSTPCTFGWTDVTVFESRFSAKTDRYEGIGVMLSDMQFDYCNLTVKRSQSGYKDLSATDVRLNGLDGHSVDVRMAITDHLTRTTTRKRVRMQLTGFGPASTDHFRFSFEDPCMGRVSSTYNGVHRQASVDLLEVGGVDRINGRPTTGVLAKDGYGEVWHQTIDLGDECVLPPPPPDGEAPA